jgi:hypothetical protein
MRSLLLLFLVVFPMPRASAKRPAAVPVVVVRPSPSPAAEIMSHDEMTEMELHQRYAHEQQLLDQVSSLKRALERAYADCHEAARAQRAKTINDKYHLTGGENLLEDGTIVRRRPPAAHPFPSPAPRPPQPSPSPAPSR